MFVSYLIKCRQVRVIATQWRLRSLIDLEASKIGLSLVNFYPYQTRTIKIKLEMIKARLLNKLLSAKIRFSDELTK